MATTAKKTAAAGPKVSAGKGLAKWDEQLAQYATALAQEQQNTGSGIPTFSLKSGVLSLGEDQLPGNEMAVIILDGIHVNKYYAEGYDPDSRSPVTCYAFGRDPLTMAPHPEVVERGQQQADACSECPMNRFGSAEKGRGKACGNRARVLCIPAGNFKKGGEFVPINDLEHYQTAQAAFLDLPVMSAGEYAKYVKQLAGALHRPPFAVVTHVKVVPDAKSQFRVTFEAIEEVGPALIEALISRHEEAKQIVTQPLRLDAEEEEAPRGRGGKAKTAPKGKPAAGRGAPAAKKAVGRKY